MSERTAMAEDTMKFGLLMESAQAHQKMAEAHLERLRAHTEDLDDVVREQIRRTFVEELHSLTMEADRAARALRDLGRTANLRGAAWSVGIAALCALVPSAIVHWALPSTSTIESLRAQRDALSKNIEDLERKGARADWHRCGDSARLCVRVDRKAPAYGEQADYYIVKGLSLIHI